MRVQHLTLPDGILMTTQDGLPLVEMLFTPSTPISLPEATERVSHLIRSLHWLLRPDTQQTHWLLSHQDLSQVSSVEYTLEDGRVLTVVVKFD